MVPWHDVRDDLGAEAPAQSTLAASQSARRKQLPAIPALEQRKTACGIRAVAHRACSSLSASALVLAAFLKLVPRPPSGKACSGAFPPSSAGPSLAGFSGALFAFPRLKSGLSLWTSARL